MPDRNSPKLKVLIGLFLVAASFAGETCNAQESEQAVLTAMPVTFAIATELLAGSGIEVINVPERGRRPDALGSYLQSRASELAETYQAATAVVTIGKLWEGDPLYSAARAGNIRIVDIDATRPWSGNLEGIAVVRDPDPSAPWEDAPDAGDREDSAYFWLSPANVARATDIVASDLVRLFPDASERIRANALDLRARLLQLQRDYEIRFSEIADVTVFSLASEFAYLTSDFGLFVLGYFLRQDIDWTDEDLQMFAAYLEENGIRVVIHKWEPDKRIAAVIAASDAELVVLDPLETGRVEEGRLIPGSYLEILEENLKSLYQGLLKANEGLTP